MDPGKPIKGIKNYFLRRKPAINEVVREATAGGIVYRFGKKGNVQILLVQDSKDRWTIPKGHIEKGETLRQTAEREVNEETGLESVKVKNWLGKIRFQFRRRNSLVLITMHVYLIEALADTNKLQKEDWMNGIQWFDAAEALEKIEYEEIGKLMLLGLQRIRQEG